MYFSSRNNNYTVYTQIDEPLTVVNAGYLLFDKFEESGYTSRPNGLPNIQILYIKSGTGIFNIENKKCEIRGGNIIIFKENEPQIYRYISEETEAYWVHFGGFTAATLLSKYDLENKIIQINNGHQIEKTIRKISNELSCKKEFFVDLINLLLKQLLIEIVRNEYISTERWAIQAIYDICEDMHNDYSSNMTNTEYAKKCKMSLAYFTKTFKAVTGTTPQDFKTMQKIELAKSMLSNTDYKMYYISNVCGFDDPLYFSRCFKKKTGNSPLNYRKKSR